MDFDPQKFFVGVVDFFSILLPGALLTFMVREDAIHWLLGAHPSYLAGTEGWVVFLFCSYLLGHFIFLLGSWALDDHLYDPLRKATVGEQVAQLAKGDKLEPPLRRWAAARIFKKGVDQPVRRAVAIKEHYLDPLAAAGAVNAFQWSKARLAIDHPAALATVERFEADSKFFRSLVVVLVLLIPWALLEQRWPLVLVSLPLLVLAFWRYFDQRVKATSQAYWFVITLEGGERGSFRPGSAGDAGPTHAGGVVVRRGGGGRREYLLVHASGPAHEWVLPKGHMEEGEAPAETAVREVREETGVWARVRKPVDEVAFQAGEEMVRACFFLMEALEEDDPPEQRGRDWLPIDDALRRAAYPEVSELLLKAERLCAAGDAPA